LGLCNTFDPCDESAPVNQTYLNFIQAHVTDARIIAVQLNVPVANVLGLAGEESTFGTSRFAAEGNNFFGLHAPEPGQSGTLTALGNRTVQVSTFPSPGFLNSGRAFAQTKGSYVRGVNDPDTFATILHHHGFGIGRSSYVANLANVIENFDLRIDCVSE
jgi:Mannosyl-glycoprotein endo-beta-N-acetylglucosaminidase